MPADIAISAWVFSIMEFVSPVAAQPSEMAAASPLGHSLPAARRPVYPLHDPPLSLLSEVDQAGASLAGGSSEPRMTITVPAGVTGPEQEFAFKPHR